LHLQFQLKLAGGQPIGMGRQRSQRYRQRWC
jgi:hypothetical protein